MRLAFRGVQTVRALSAAALAALLIPACSGIGRARAVALYPEPERGRAPEAVARLEGPIRAVDGVRVETKGTTFELLPGCHVVTMTPRVGGGNVSGSWSADFGLVVYAFRMVPGRTYSIEAEPRFGSAGHGNVKLNAYERNADGTIAGTVWPASGDDDIRACEGWAEAQGFGPAAVPAFAGEAARPPTAPATVSFPR